MNLLNRFRRWLNPPVEAAALPIVVEAAKLPHDKFRHAMEVAIRMMAEDQAKGKFEPFTVPTAAPGVVTKEAKMAVDSACGQGQTNGLYNYANEFASIWEEGQAFLGYPVLSWMALRTEYRRPTEILADEMTRNWGKVAFIGEQEEKDAIASKMEVIEEELTRIKAQDVMRRALEQDGFFGGSHIFIDMGNTDNVPELAKPLAMTPQKIKLDSFVGLTVVEPMWVYPSTYNSINPLRSDFYKPETWYVMNMHVHNSRMMTIVSREVPDLLKPAYSFRGLSLSQMLKPYVDNWLQTRQAVNDIIQKFRTTVLATQMDVSTMGAAETFFARIKMFVAGRNNSGVLAIDKENEEFQDVTASLASLDKLQAQSQEHMATPPGIPLVKLFGITPTGLNATAEPEMQAFYESLSSSQEKNGTPVMTKTIELIQLSKFGEIDKGIVWQWNPLKHMDKKEEAEIDLLRAQADDMRIANGTIDNAEAREALAHDEDGPYPGLDLNYTPELPEVDSSGDGNEPTRGIEGSK